FAAAATRRLRLLTHVLVLPYRNPLLVAKAAASLDVLSGGRLLLGVAAGYLAGEFAALGAALARRHEAVAEAIRAVRAAWRGAPPLAVLSVGRLLPGVAAAYLAGELAALGADPAPPNGAVDEAIRAVRAAWRGAPFAFAGTGYAARGIEQRPPPVQRPGPPIW